jgi:hypothetical protein
MSRVLHEQLDKKCLYFNGKSQDSLVIIVSGYGLDDRAIEVLFPAKGIL